MSTVCQQLEFSRTTFSIVGNLSLVSFTVAVCIAESLSFTFLSFFFILCSFYCWNPLVFFCLFLIAGTPFALSCFSLIAGIPFPLGLSFFNCCNSFFGIFFCFYYCNYFSGTSFPYILTTFSLLLQFYL